MVKLLFVYKSSELYLNSRLKIIKMVVVVTG